MPLGGGLETLVADVPTVTRGWGHMALVETGIHYAGRDRTGLPATSAIFDDFARRDTRRVATLARSPGGGHHGLDVSPDGRKRVFTQFDRTGTDLMRLEHFR